jgi:hypothetical protein
MPMGQYFYYGAELGGEKAPWHGPFLRGGMVHYLRKHRRSGWNGLKLTHMIGPINATPEQSFPPGNSIGKVGCCVVVVAGAV